MKIWLPIRLMTAFILAQLSVVNASYAAAASEFSAQHMLSVCRPITTTKITSDGRVKLPQDFGTGFCWGAFASIQRAITFVDESGRPILRICAPEESTLIQMISIFVKFAENNPQRLHENYFFLAMESLGQAFPCKKR